MTATLTPSRSAPPAIRAERVLTVEFRSPQGRSWSALGGGATVADAVASARESCPSGTWSPVGWRDLYGE